MPMTVVTTRNVANRFRGFLSSCMFEIASGTYVSPNLSAGVRNRVWQVLLDWSGLLLDSSIIMIWQDKTLPGGLGIKTLGTPPVEFIDKEGFLLARFLKPDQMHPPQFK